LQAVLAGGSEIITTSNDSGHTHTFTITKWY
jgi:hypothetical protein